MKKITNRVFFTCLIAEMLVFLCTLLLVKRSDYIWYVIGFLAIMIILTFYECANRLTQSWDLWSENKRIREETQENVIKSYYTQIFNEMKSKVKDLSEGIGKLSVSQEKMLESNDSFCKKINESVIKLGDNGNKIFDKVQEEISLSNSIREKQINELIRKSDENIKITDEKNKEFIQRITCLFEEQNSKTCNYLSGLENVSAEIKHSVESSFASQIETTKQSEEVLKNIYTIIEKLEEGNNQNMSDLSKKFMEHSQTMSEQNTLELSNLGNELKNAFDLLTKNYKQALEEMSILQKNQIAEYQSGIAEIMSKSSMTVENMMNIVEEKLLQNSDTVTKNLDANITSTRNVVSEIVNDTRDLLQKQCEKFENLNTSLSVDTKEYTQQLMEQILDVSKTNISEMNSSCEKALEFMIERIVSENAASENKKNLTFDNYIKQLEETYNLVISEHIKALEEQIINSISLFISENKAALMSNNELATELITSEKTFVSEIEANNEKLRETIDNAFVEYNKSVEQNISEMGKIMEDSISACAKSTISSIKIMTEKNTGTVDMLAETLKEYSDSLVEKSAIAIADVQSDNNEKLQSLCEQVSGYISENNKFALHCQNMGDSLQRSIIQMIDDRDGFITDMNDVMKNHIEGFDVQLKSRVQNMIDQIQTLNIENATLFSDAMDGYREKFVEANASAIAEVQVDNVSSITDANNKISQMASNLKKFQEDISGTLGVLSSIIENGVNDQKAQDESFDEIIRELIDEKLSEYNSKLQKYNEYIEILGGKITEVMLACQNNTSKYEETLGFIVESQKEANSLNDKDLDLLKSFIKR